MIRHAIFSADASFVSFRHAIDDAIFASQSRQLIFAGGFAAPAAATPAIFAAPPRHTIDTAVAASEFSLQALILMSS